MVHQSLAIIISSVAALAAIALSPGPEVQVGVGRNGPVANAPLNGSYLLTVKPDMLTADEHVGGPGEQTLVYEFTVPEGVSLRGGGWPQDLYRNISEDVRSTIQLELPFSRRANTGEETAFADHGGFVKPIFCWIYDSVCLGGPDEGRWTSQLITAGGSQVGLQLATPRIDSVNKDSLAKEIGVYFPENHTLLPGDRVQFIFHGKAPARSTDWMQRPLVANFRYRTDPLGCAEADGCWITLDDAQVQPLNIAPLSQAAVVRVAAPLDVASGEPFNATVVVTDRFGNPVPYTGTVRLLAETPYILQFNAEYSKTVQLSLQNPGFARLALQVQDPGIRRVAQWVKAWAGTPPRQRLLGDIHAHTGDGGAQRKFLRSSTPGDHRGLFSSTQDALFYMEKIAGYDFGAISEHAVRQDGYTLPQTVAADAAFAPGGACDGVQRAITDLGNWWQTSQQAARDYAAGSGMVVFPAFEWHAQHYLQVHGDDSPLHRVVLYRDFDANNQLPILPGEIEGIAPQCLVRFLLLAGYGPDQALIAPHMMNNWPSNTDWDLTYEQGGPGELIADRLQVESYHRVGEIYSARANKPSLQGVQRLKAFEGEDQDPGRWSFRYGWRNHGAHIGIIGGSDDHAAMPGSDNTLLADGTSMQASEPGGTTIVLSRTRDRDGIFDAMRARSSYATSGVRVWHDFRIDGAPMGSRIARNTSEVGASLQIASGQLIVKVELWATKAGDNREPYQDILGAEPIAELYRTSIQIPNPVVSGAADEEWLYYVRAFFASSHGDPANPEDALWSSPIWVTWSNP